MHTQDDKKPLLKWFWNSYVMEHFGILFIALIFMSIEGSMLGVLSYSIKFLFDNVLVSKDTSSIFFVAILIFSIFSIRAIAGFIHRLMTVNVCQKIIKILQLLSIYLLKSNFALLYYYFFTYIFLLLLIIVYFFNTYFFFFHLS